MKPETIGLSLNNDDEWIFDRTLEFDYSSYKNLILQYKASGYRNLTIIKIIKEKFPEVTERQIHNTISRFVFTNGYAFRKHAPKAEWSQFYKQQGFKSMGKPAKGTIGEFTTNKPINVKSERKIKGIIKYEQKSLKLIALRWITKAENDLKAVKQLLAFEDSPTDVISFHCQQSVEKYLKAYLKLVDVSVKNIHDLKTILYLCMEEDKDFKELDT